MSKWQEDYDIEIRHYGGRFFRFEVDCFYQVHTQVAHFRARSQVVAYVWSIYRCWAHHIMQRFKR